MKIPNFALNSVYAKVKALYGKRLTEKNYNDLLRLNSVTEIAEYLRTRTAYAQIFEGLSSTEKLQRSRLENLLFNKMYDEMVSVMRFQKAAGNSLYEYFIMKYDIQQIINVISSLETKSENYFFTFPVFYNEHSKLDLYALAQAKTDMQILECTKHTVYYSALRDALTKYRLTGSLTALQTDLSVFLDGQFLSLAFGKGKPDKKSECLALYKCLNDTDFVSMLYRIKRFSFDGNSEQIVATPELTAFTVKELNAMRNASTAGELTEILKTTYLKAVAADEDNTDIHYRLNKYMFEQLVSTVRSSSSPEAVMLAYFHYNEFEIRNIINIIEGKRYSLAKDEIEAMLFVSRMP